jgi:hypothetical protein
MKIDLDRLLLEAGPLEPGAFFIQKCIFIEEGKNINNGERCENLSYGGVGVAVGTPYEKDSWETGLKSDYDEDFVVLTTTIEKWGHIISVVPNFFIDYLQMKQVGADGSPGTPDLQKNLTPFAMWIGRSIYQLFKTMREWSFMIEEPFNSDHPMAIYSKMAIDFLEVPQAIIDEIDAMPDMHLAKFLKGQEDYKLIPEHPAMSQAFKQWIVDITEKYPTLTFEEKIIAALGD